MQYLSKLILKPSLENKALVAWFVNLPHPPHKKMYAVTRTSNIFQLSNQKSAKDKYLSNNITDGVMDVTADILSMNVHAVSTLFFVFLQP